MEQTNKKNRLINLAKRKTYTLEFADCKVIEKDSAEKGSIANFSGIKFALKAKRLHKSNQKVLDSYKGKRQ
jgi:hypothetical protein